MLEYIRLAVANAVFLTLIGTSATAGAGHDVFSGELEVLHEYSRPELRSGHEAMQPVADALQGYFSFKEAVRSNHGFSYVVEYSPQYQFSLSEPGLDHGNDETNLIAQWSVVDPTDSRAGSLLAWYQISRTLGSLNTSEFMHEAGAVSPVNGGDTAPGDYRDLWQMLAWEQWILDNKLRIGAGKLTTRTFLNLNRYAVSDREDFFSPMLVNNPVAPFAARNGMGVFVQYHLEDAYLTGMIREADGTSEGISFSTLDSGNWESAVELGLTPTLKGYGEGNYRFTAYYTDSIAESDTPQPAGWSLALSFDQDIGQSYGLLLRYAWVSEDFRAFRQRLAVGMQWLHPLGFQHDRIGLGAWWADPTAADLEAEYGLEAFWKLQLSPFLEFGPDLQLIFNPQDGAEDDPVVVAGLRIRLII